MADKLRERLGWQTGIANEVDGKPKGMHWQTFLRVQDSHDDYVRQALGGMWATLGKTVSTLEHIDQVTDDL